jgi:pyruvate dehydrogenase E2 component (dihydrolipoamide acetyltransferase)
MVNETGQVLSTGTAIALKGIKRVAARRMVQAWEAPVFHLSTDVKMEVALLLAKKDAGNTVTDVLISAVAAALRENPELNAHYSEEIVTLYSEINIGLAVATDAGLMVPVVHDVADADLKIIAKKRQDVVTKAREGKLSMPDVEGATFTISNLGPLGIDSFDAIVNPPQVAILAIGSTKESVVVEEGSIVIKKVASFTLTCDHRAIDGATGSKFLASLRNIIEHANDFLT